MKKNEEKIYGENVFAPKISDTEVMLTFNYSGVPFYSRVTSNFAIKCSQIMPNNLGIITNSVEPDNIGRTADAWGNIA